MLYPTLTIIRGLPGSGKTTLARKWYHCPIIEADQFLYTERSYDFSPQKYAQIQPYFLSAINNVIACGCDGCVTGVFATQSCVRAIICRAITRGYRVVIHTMRRHHGDEHNVCSEDAARMKDAFMDHDVFMGYYCGAAWETSADDRGIGSKIISYKTTDGTGEVDTSIIEYDRGE